MLPLLIPQLAATAAMALLCFSQRERQIVTDARARGWVRCDSVVVAAGDGGEGEDNGGGERPRKASLVTTACGIVPLRWDFGGGARNSGREEA